MQDSSCDIKQLRLSLSGVMTLALVFKYIVSIALSKFGGIPYSFRIHIIFALCKESESFLKSMKVMIAGK